MVGDMSRKAANQPATWALTSAQTHALFDILTHHETYGEVERFKLPGFISRFGHPFLPLASPAGLEHGQDGADSTADEALDSGGPDSASSTPNVSAAPLIATLFRTVVLTAPGLKLLSPTFWNVQARGLLDRFADAELSESYDKGTLGTRKTLATAASVLQESLVRGMLGGVWHGGGKRDLRGPYDARTAVDLVRAWEDVVHELAYGGLIDELFECAMTNGNVEKHSPAAERCVDYIILHLATFLHYAFILSPEGPYLLKLLGRTHSLTPYYLIRQTLKVGNAATMINGMTHLMLAKVSIGALSNWIGITQNADDGMNLLQRIISVVLSTDGADFRKQADKIERAKSGPSKDQLAAIRDYISKPRSVHEEAREHSRTNRVSMVARILEASGKPGLLASLSPSQHDQCVEYLAALLSARDRDEITRALCQQQPDLFTQTAREYMATLSPILRVVLERVDLGAHVTSLETFINDLIRISKPRTGDGSGNKSGSGHGLVSSVKNTLKKSENGRTLTPSIEDYVSLLRRNRQLLYSFLQQAAGKCTDLRTELKAWCKDFIKEFRQDSAQEQHANLEEGRKGGAGRMSGNLQSLFSGLPEDKQAVVLASLDSHADYLEKLEKVSMARMQSVLDNLPGAGEDEPAVGSRSAGSVWGSRATRPTRDAPRSMYGPGMFLSRWQDLLDVTLVAPATLRGPVRRGKDLKGAVMSGKTASQPKCAWDPEELTRQAERAVPVAPDVDVVFEALGPVFRALVGERLVRGNV